MTSVLDRVARGNLCTGCGACAALSSAVAMDDRQGFLRPRQIAPIAAEEDEAIAGACPGLGLRLKHDAPLDHVFWGPIREVRQGHAADPTLRHEASSGGALSAVLIHLLTAGEVDFVLQTAADPQKPTGNRTVLSRSPQAVLSAAGSRYAPSAPLENLEDVLVAALGSGERGAFVGKPCDVAALRAIAARDRRVAQVFPHVLSFFCAGVPNLAGAEAVAARLGFTAPQIARFRYRGRGWPGRAAIETSDGRIASMSYAESWGDILSKHVQFRCKICPDGVGSFADLVCADAWETDAAGYPVFDEAPGVSLVIARTQRGAELLAAAEAAGAIEVGPLAPEAITPMQPGQVKRKRLVSTRLAALACLARPRPRFAGLRLSEAARLARPAERLRNFLGTLRRTVARQG